MSSDWKPIARRGELEVIVFTRAAFLRKCPTLLHDEAALVSIIAPDGSDSATPLQHPSVESARSFIREMQPHTLDVVGDRGEDVAALRATLNAALASRPADVTLN